MDDWLVVNLGVHLQLAKKIDISKSINFCIWQHVLESFTNRDNESYSALSWKYESGGGMKYSPDHDTIIAAVKLIP